MTTKLAPTIGWAQTMTGSIRQSILWSRILKAPINHDSDLILHTLSKVQPKKQVIWLGHPSTLPTNFSICLMQQLALQLENKSLITDHCYRTTQMQPKACPSVVILHCRLGFSQEIKIIKFVKHSLSFCESLSMCSVLLPWSNSAI